MERLRAIWQWMEQHPDVVWGVSLASVALLIVGLLSLPIVLLRLPEDYFVREEAPEVDRTAGHVALRVLRNVLGVVVLLAGIAMLALPGQGLLTVLAGLLLLDFPGKRRLTLRIVRREGVRKWVDRLRRKAGKEPLEIPE